MWLGWQLEHLNKCPDACRAFKRPAIRTLQASVPASAPTFVQTFAQLALGTTAQHCMACLQSSSGVFVSCCLASNLT
jgi:hypothetical protein